MIKPWMEAILRDWHSAHPVSDEEKERNENIYENFQKNRNPYIDHPEYLDKISSFSAWIWL